MMHFHSAAHCFACGHDREFSTPLPNTLILAAQCEWCGFIRMIGVTDARICRECEHIRIEDDKYLAKNRSPHRRA